MSVSDKLFRHMIAVTNRRVMPKAVLEQLERVCSVKPAGVILREKDLTEAQYQALAEEVLALCRPVWRALYPARISRGSATARRSERAAAALAAGSGRREAGARRTRADRRIRSFRTGSASRRGTGRRFRNGRPHI